MEEMRLCQPGCVFAPNVGQCNSFLAESIAGLSHCPVYSREMLNLYFYHFEICFHIFTDSNLERVWVIAVHKTKSNLSSHCGIVTSYGFEELCGHSFRYWLVARQNQANTWSNVELPLRRFSGTHFRVIFTWIFEIPVIKLCLKFTHCKSKSHS